MLYKIGHRSLVSEATGYSNWATSVGNIFLDVFHLNDYFVSVILEHEGEIERLQESQRLNIVQLEEEQQDVIGNLEARHRVQLVRFN